jgi:hypothetical protein
MNFVGTELDVSTGVVTRSPASPFSEPDDQEDSLPDAHPPMSPKGGAESLFLNDLETQQISAFHLADIIHQQYRIDSTTVATDDFVTAVGERLSPVDSSSIDVFFSSSSVDPSNSSPFGKDALAHSRVLSDDSTPHEEHFHDTNMSASSSSSTKTDAAEKAYDTAKSVWGWGKSVTILSPFLGLAEGVASKVATMAGTSLDSVDGSIQHQLEVLDGKYLNPAIAAIVNMLMGTVNKSEEVLKPLIQALLKPVGLIKKDAETPEVTTPSNPALTATPVK